MMWCVLEIVTERNDSFTEEIPTQVRAMEVGIQFPLVGGLL